MLKSVLDFRSESKASVRLWRVYGLIYIYSVLLIAALTIPYFAILLIGSKAGFLFRVLLAPLWVLDMSMSVLGIVYTFLFLTLGYSARVANRFELNRKRALLNALGILPLIALWWPWINPIMVA